ncbi:hypothetical protein BTUL_0112g00320 [Botrytis tulipae]|uniref:Uncharacterized protein n=1 Tax=Botrytis tulipae TaxID=87230 RepID=A0A4Z1EKD5_9HELO|nr:hypothetical protein BTUL_0112g00320 [Botrytis tulipae]
MCVDILTKFSCTSRHTKLPYPGYTILRTEECPYVQKTSNDRPVRPESRCAKGPIEIRETRTNNIRNLCPKCTEHSRGLNRRQEVLAWDKKLEDEMRNSRDKMLEEEMRNSWLAVLARKEDLERLEMLARSRKRIRREELDKLEKQNAPVRRQPSAPGESSSQGVDRSYVGPQFDMEEGEIREEGYRSQAEYSSQERHSSRAKRPSQAKHSSQTDLTRKIENARQSRSDHTKESQHKRPPPDTQKRINSEKENASDKIQLQLKGEYNAEVLASTRKRVPESRAHLSRNTRRRNHDEKLNV